MEDLMIGRTSLVGMSMLALAFAAAGAPDKTVDSRPEGPQPQPPPAVEKAEPIPPPPPSEQATALSWKTKFKIKPRTPVKDLLPTAPKASKSAVSLGNDLRKVPELVFEAPPAKQLSTKEWTKRTGRNLAKADHLNARKKDGFVKALVAERADLSGLPFLMGDD